ncbi:MAG: hypothetical protein EOP09_08300, partial [Proteobacteria bacterium]
AHFVALQSGGKIQLAPDALDALVEETWPGNIRELKSRVDIALAIVAARKDRFLKRTDFDFGTKKRPIVNQSSKVEFKEEPELNAAVYESSLRELDRRLVQRALKNHHGDVGLAAIQLGLSTPTMYRKIKDLGVKKDVRVSLA